MDVDQRLIRSMSNVAMGKVAQPNYRRCREGMVWRRRWHSPFQAMRAFPCTGLGLRTVLERPVQDGEHHEGRSLVGADDLPAETLEPAPDLRCAKQGELTLRLRGSHAIVLGAVSYTHLTLPTT